MITLSPVDQNVDIAVSVLDLWKQFGDRSALVGANLRIPRGAVTLLAGANGAGKSTLMRILLDLMRADTGSAVVLGLDSTRHGAAVRARCGYMSERADATYPWMRAGDALRLHASYRSGWDRAYAERLMTEFDIPLGSRVGELSTGEVRQLQLLSALAHWPELLVLDEPTSGLDPVMRETTLRLLAEHIAARETTVLLATHLISDVDGLCDRIAVIRGGRIEHQLTREALRRTLRSYQVVSPTGWTPPPRLKRLGSAGGAAGREAEWLIWGEPNEVSASLTATGARVRDVRALSLDRAIVAMLTGSEAVGVEGDV